MKTIFWSESEDLLPIKKIHSDAGWDLKAAEDTVIPAGSSALVSTKTYAEIPEGYVGLIQSRSGLALKNSIAKNAGVIDSEYRGEIKVLLHNLSEPEYEICGNDVVRKKVQKNDFYIKKGDRIAQILIIPVALECDLKVGIPEKSTERGSKGFGSSGK